MIIDRRTKLRMRRIFRKRRRQVENIGLTTEETIERHFFKRLIKLVEVRRFVFGWVGLLIVLTIGLLLQMQALSSHYQTLKPAEGGIYREGIIGTFTNANPLYAQNAVDAAVSKLVFSSLLKYDESGKLIPDLAESYALDQAETTYTVRLKHNVRWHDGELFTAKDVVFTYGLIKNPEAKSYLFSSWKPVTVKATDDYTVTFKLPNALSAFPASLTNGILPEHVLNEVPASKLRSSNFNNEQPIGTGPFRLQTVEVANGAQAKKNVRIALNANNAYFLGSPKLERFVIRTYDDETSLTNGFADKQIDGLSGLNTIPEDKKLLVGSQQFDTPVTSEVMVFFKGDQEVLKDPIVRKALVLATDKKSVLGSVSYPLMSIDGPLLRSDVGYDKKYGQVTGNKTEAEKMLDQNGWVKDQSGIRSKNGIKLSFRLYSGSTAEFTAISGSLQKQWRDLGVDVQVMLQPDEELQSTVSLHNYDALLYGIAVGPDPDVFAYWHSTQADIRSDTRLNFSEYKSVPADRALEAGRTRSDPQIRAVKYRPFLEAWRNDAPALALYQSRYLYIASDSLHGYDPKLLVTGIDRFAHVEQWSARQELQNE